MESAEEWEKFRDVVLECTSDVCGMRRVAEQRRKGSEWWNEEGVGRWPKREDLLRNVNGRILRDGVEVSRRWAEHFEQVMKVADVREANVNVVGNWRMPVLRDLNGRANSLEEVREAVN